LKIFGLSRSSKASIVLDRKMKKEALQKKEVITIIEIYKQNYVLGCFF